jgi:hypothetical protein
MLTLALAAAGFAAFEIAAAKFGADSRVDGRRWL